MAAIDLPVELDPAIDRSAVNAELPGDGRLGEPLLEVMCE